MSTASLLPEDYLAQKAERRTNLICLTLFAVVMASVFGAFLVTNKQWSRLKVDQEVINAQYQEAGMQIQELSELEAQKKEMLNRAELAGALVERVPRSILLAELINRMPPRLGLLEFELTSAKIKTQRVVSADKDKTKRLKGPTRARTKEEAQETLAKVAAPKYEVAIAMTGVAPTDLEVSRYMAELNSYDLVRTVTLDYSEEKEIEGRKMREFKINMTLSQTADVRSIEPLIVPRGIRNPMTDELELSHPALRNTASATPNRSNGD
jgi:Tfp pilus assembly protein PilN